MRGGSVVCNNNAAPNSLQQAEEVHDVLGVDFVPVGIQSVWGKNEETKNIYSPFGHECRFSTEAGK